MHEACEDLWTRGLHKFRNHPVILLQSPVRFASPTAPTVMFFPALRASLVALGSYTIGVLAVASVFTVTHDRKWIVFWLAAHLIME